MYVVGDPMGGGAGGGQPTTVPIPPDLQKFLKQIFDAVKTIYIQQVDFAEDKTVTTHVSATSGLGSGGTGGGSTGGGGGGTGGEF